MSFESLVNREDYVASGSANEYDYDFYIQSSAHLRVTVQNTDGVETLLVLTTDYTVDGAGEGAGGSITLVDTNQAWLDAQGDLTVGYILTIRRVLPLTQATDIRNQGSYFPEDIEDAFDKLTMIAQQQQDEIERSIRLPETVLSDDFDTELPADIVGQANMILGTSEDGDGIVLLEVSDVAAMGAQTSHTITESQAATALTDETVLAASFTSAVYNYEILRGTTVFSTGTFSLHYRASAWYVAIGEERKENAAPQHGVTFTVTGTTTAQLKAAVATDGAGNGTIKLKRHLFSA